MRNLTPSFSVAGSFRAVQTPFQRKDAKNAKDAKKTWISLCVLGVLCVLASNLPSENHRLAQEQKNAISAVRKVTRGV